MKKIYALIFAVLFYNHQPLFGWSTKTTPVYKCQQDTKTTIKDYDSVIYLGYIASCWICTSSDTTLTQKEQYKGGAIFCSYQKYTVYPEDSLRGYYKTTDPTIWFNDIFTGLPKDFDGESSTCSLSLNIPSSGTSWQYFNVSFSYTTSTAPSETKTVTTTLNLPT